MKPLLISILIFFTLIFLVFRNAVFQEGNPLPIIAATFTIPFTDNGFARYDEGKYIALTKDADERLKAFMKIKGYDFTEQLGSGYLYKNMNGKTLIVTGKMYSRFFRIYNIHE